ncbi:MAG: NFACT RNA binding domain-containing protein [Clostridia bacterium]|nr:NFACT RNA binding domain-containing protein [Clostridia bacterium]
MPQDAFTLNHLCRELNGLLSGGKINKIIQPENERVELSVYNGKGTYRFILDVKPSSPRIGITDEVREALLTAPNFCMLLRKHLSGATINEIKLMGFDRVVAIRCTGGGEFYSEEKTLYVELMGRYSNIILTENGKVLGGNRGINFFDNGVRPLIVGLPYAYPPVGEKKVPDDVSLISYFEAFDGDDLSLYITAGVQGVSLLTAKEAVDGFRENFNGKNFYLYLKKFLYSETLTPCVLVENGRVKDVFAYPYKTVKGEYVYFPSLYEAEDYFFTNKDKDTIFNNKKNELTSCVSASIKKYNKKLTAVCQRERLAEDSEKYRLYGEFILANMYKLKRGDSSFTATNYYDGTELLVPLDENLSPSQNAENYYKKYTKARRTLENVIPQKNKIIEEINYLNAVKDEIDLCETVSDTESIKNELISAGILNEKRINIKKKVQKTKRTYIVNGFTVNVGRNNVENDEITISAAKSDIWLHAKDIHSSHVVIECNGKLPDDKTLLIAAEICAYYSHAREDGRVEVVYTQRKNVKKPNGAKPGFFVYDNYSSISVKPLKHEELMKNE